MSVSSVKNLNGETFSAVQDASFVAYSADQWEMSAGEGVSFVNDIQNKITRIDVTGGGGGLTGDYVSGYNVVVKPDDYPGEWQPIHYSAVEVSGDVKLKTWHVLSGHEDYGHYGEKVYSLYDITQSTANWNSVSDSYRNISANILTNSPKGTIKTEGHKLESTNSAVVGEAYTIEGDGVTQFYVSALPGYPYSKYTITPTGRQDFEVRANYGTSEWEMYVTLQYYDGLPHDLPVTSGGKDLMWVSPIYCNVVAGEEQVVELALKSDLPTYEYDSTNKISAINGSAIAAGDEFPISADEAIQYVENNSATINDVNTSYQTNSGTFLTAHQAISAEEWNGCYDNVNTNSGAWGGSALPISAGPGIKVNLVDNTLVFSNDETLLWEGVFTTATSGITLSEVADNFEKLKFVHNWNGNGTWGEYDETIVPVSAASSYKITLSHIVQIASTGAAANVYYTTNTIAFESTANNKFVHIGGYRSNFAGSNTSTTDITRITKILGINRK